MVRLCCAEWPLPLSMLLQQRKEKENEFYLGGMRNPDVSVSKLHMVASVGMDISRAWNRFIKDNPKALDIAVTYGGPDCKPDLETANNWRAALEKMLKAKEFEDVIIREDYEFRTPLNTKLLAAWQRATRDPEVHVVDWARRGVPLGMNKRIDTCGIFPAARDEYMEHGDAPPLELMENTRNYTSFYGCGQRGNRPICGQGLCHRQGHGLDRWQIQLRHGFRNGAHSEGQGRWESEEQGDS